MLEDESFTGTRGCIDDYVVFSPKKVDRLLLAKDRARSNLF
jgi:hypothetical protein